MKGLNAYISLRGDEGVNQCTRAFRACSFTAWFSRLKCIKSDCKIQDMGQKMYIFTFHMIKITGSVQFFSSNISMITNLILILYNSSINNKLILRDLSFRHHIACFCSVSPAKNNYKPSQRCFESQWFVPEWINESFKWLGSVATTHLLTVICCHLLAVSFHI